MSNYKQGWQKEGLTNDRGELRANLSRLSSMITPPSAWVEEVTLEDQVFIYGDKGPPAWTVVRSQDNRFFAQLPGLTPIKTLAIDNRLSCICYPVSGFWEPPLENGDVELSNGLVDELGWKTHEGKEGLLEDFINLHKAPPEKIIKFVLRWGPLWRCFAHEDCQWVPSYFEFPNKDWRAYSHINDCLWLPKEPIAAFHIEASKAKAAFDIAELLRQNKPAPLEFWEPFHNSESPPRFRDERQRNEFSKDVQRQRRELAMDINLSYLLTPLSPRFFIEWNENSKASLRIDTGFGFLWTVWLQIAQLLCGVYGFYTCASCGHSYLRNRRKPAAGRMNYCDDCCKSGPKKLHARKRRERTLEKF